MISAPLEATPLRLGDRVGLHGTRIVGDVKRIDRGDDHDWVNFKVTAILGKPSTSKAARAWQGAWVTCTPEMVVPLH